MIGSSLDYIKVAAAIDALELGIDAAEFHGGICGLLCARGPGAVAAWLRESAIRVRRESTGSGAATESLHDAEAQTWRILNGTSLDFYPLLPDDELGLAERVRALGLWCHGFLAGLGLGGWRLEGADAESAVANAQLPEIVADFTEISRVAAAEDELENPRQAGFDLAELVEYVRVGVQLAFEELRPRREPDTADSAPFTRH